LGGKTDPGGRCLQGGIAGFYARIGFVMIPIMEGNDYEAVSVIVSLDVCRWLCRNVSGDRLCCRKSGGQSNY
jgi:hypothetical protein